MNTNGAGTIWRSAPTGRTSSCCPAAAAAALSGPVNEFKDIAEDFQYQFVGDEHLFSLAGTRIHESMQLAASFAAGAFTNPSDNGATIRGPANYYFPPTQ